MYHRPVRGPHITEVQSLSRLLLLDILVPLTLDPPTNVLRIPLLTLDIIPGPTPIITRLPVVPTAVLTPLAVSFTSLKFPFPLTYRAARIQSGGVINPVPTRTLLADIDLLVVKVCPMVLTFLQLK